jgi:type II secretory pathway component PulF
MSNERKSVKKSHVRKLKQEFSKTLEENYKLKEALQAMRKQLKNEGAGLDVGAEI